MKKPQRFLKKPHRKLETLQRIFIKAERILTRVERILQNAERKSNRCERIFTILHRISFRHGHIFNNSRHFAKFPAHFFKGWACIFQISHLKSNFSLHCTNISHVLLAILAFRFSERGKKSRFGRHFTIKMFF